LGYLYHLCEKTINPDIIASVFDIVFFLYNRLRRYLEEPKIMSFVLGVFRKLPPFLYLSPRSRSKANLIKSVRKRSCEEHNRAFTMYPRSYYRNHSIDRRHYRSDETLGIKDVKHVIPIKPVILV
jgi:hypothetical protein